MLNAIKDVVRKSSIHVCIVNCGGCNGCDVELVALTSPRYDLEQYGIYVHNNPREADVLLLTGAVTEQWVDNLKRVYDKAPEPKIVVAVGNCPQSGDVFNQEGGKVYAPASDFIPVDAEIPGCPPRPSEILEAILAVGPQAIANRGRKRNDITYWSDSPIFKRTDKAKTSDWRRKVVKAEIEYGYVHRGIEKIIEGKTWQKGIYLAERVCGICSYEHTQSFAETIERISGVLCTFKKLSF